jgi:predicted transposase YdaD
MNPHDAPILPLLTALNSHPLHRRQGTLVQRAEVEEALSDLGLEAGPLPEGRLINAMEVEKLLAAAGISVELVKHMTAADI